MLQHSHPRLRKSSSVITAVSTQSWGQGVIILSTNLPSLTRPLCKSLHLLVVTHGAFVVFQGTGGRGSTQIRFGKVWIYFQGLLRISQSLGVALEFESRRRPAGYHRMESTGANSLAGTQGGHVDLWEQLAHVVELVNCCKDLTV